MRRSFALLLMLLLPLPGFALNGGLGEPPVDVDRRTPMATAAGFLDAAHARDAARAPHYLSLSHLPPEQQAEEGLRLARRLVFVMDRMLWLDYSNISQKPEGDPADPVYDSLGQIPLPRGAVDIRLQRMERPEGAVWVFSEDTVRAIDTLFAVYGSPVLEKLPPLLFVRPVWVLELWQWLGLGVLLVAAWLAGRLVEAVALRVGSRATGITQSGWDDQLVAAGKGPLRHPVAALVVASGTRMLLLPPPAQHLVDLVARSLVIASLAWFLMRFVKLAAGFLEHRVGTESQDVARVRGLRTQLAVMRRVIECTVVLVAGSLLLLQFEAVRNVGVSLLASAGIAGLVLGLAAQKSISTLLAGIQLSITQPVRIGDTVIVEGEWGWVEEITLTYIVVKVWDLRRLVVPMSHFLDKPFQNWSKVSPDIMGTAEVFVDFRTDVPAVRAELRRICETDGVGLWDGKVAGLQVTECTERTIKLRALVSAPDSGKAWDLRCMVREKLIAFLQKQPHGLPMLRAEATHANVQDGAAVTLGVVPLSGPAGANVVVAAKRQD
ncbi:mechanosensitive ion channel family protein [Myxococcus xanthus]|uniref:mechanosensitive ion channel family protein n=1 Tax=Myxococcus xanthus TaxID=34 RepID=UPI001916FD46|nr:mechanosensitive ion channel family protein [Myxococcus xanthus]QQR45102.1 mechanosensitive ion channel family protein [Myxococcus xanthus]